MNFIATWMPISSCICQQWQINKNMNRFDLLIDNSSFSSELRLFSCILEKNDLLVFQMAIDKYYSGLAIVCVVLRDDKVIHWLTFLYSTTETRLVLRHLTTSNVPLQYILILRQTSNHCIWSQCCSSWCSSHHFARATDAVDIIFMWWILVTTSLNDLLAVLRLVNPAMSHTNVGHFGTGIVCYCLRELIICLNCQSNTETMMRSAI